MKRFLALVLTLLMCLSLAACGSSDETTPSDDSTDTPADDTTAESTPDIASLKIGAFSNSTTTDGGYTQAFYNDLKAVQAAYNMSDDQIIMVENVYDGTPDVSNIIQQLITEGCNMIIAHSNGYCDDMAKYAEQYPDIRFYCYEGTTSELVNAYTINNLEVMYLMGYLCSAMSDGDELGFIAPMQNSHIIRSMDAFALGAKKQNPNATVKVMWVNSWWDPETDKLCAETLIGAGVNVMAYYGSTATALQACEAAGAYCTGFHVDMHDYAPKACLTSFVWNWQPILSEMIDRYLNNDMSMDIIYGDMSTDCAHMADINTDIVPAEIADEVNALMEEAKAGGLDVFAGPIYDNEGNLVVEEGDTITKDELIGLMFLVDNIDGNVA